MTHTSHDFVVTTKVFLDCCFALAGDSTITKFFLVIFFLFVTTFLSLCVINLIEFNTFKKDVN